MHKNKTPFKNGLDMTQINNESNKFVLKLYFKNVCK